MKYNRFILLIAIGVGVSCSGMDKDPIHDVYESGSSGNSDYDSAPEEANRTGSIELLQRRVKSRQRSYDVIKTFRQSAEISGIKKEVTPERKH